MDALIFDDDPFVTDVLATILRRQGYTVETFADGLDARSKVRTFRPRLVVMDIMMPGADGLTLVKELKSDAQASASKILVVSAKAFPEDRDEALRSGADAFVKKPFDAQKLSVQLRQLIESLPKAAAEPAAGAATPVLAARVWGARAAQEAPGGPPTSCVSLSLGDRLIVLDAGTGLKNLCAAPRPASQTKEPYFLLTHYHPDHVAGLGDLTWSSDPAYTLQFIGPAIPAGRLAQLLQETLAASGSLKARIRLTTAGEGAFSLWPDVAVAALHAMHPGSTLAYRIEHQGKRVVYCPDNMIEADADVQSDHNEKLGRFIRGCDLLLHDARWLEADFPQERGKGHCSPGTISEFAARHGVRRLVLFHLDASYRMDQLTAALGEVRGFLKDSRSPMEADLGVEGAVFSV